MCPRHALAACLMLAATGGAAAESVIGRPLPESLPGSQPPVAAPDWPSVALDGLTGKVVKALLAAAPASEPVLRTRGRKEIEIYRQASPAVVLILTSKGLGSGTYLGEGRVLTNWHVIGSFRQVGVLFKPAQEGAEADRRAVVRAGIVRTDPVRDLALLKVALVPETARTLALGSEAEIEVGADVHAIGHPTGQTWTYTKGLISQFRRDYEWKIDRRTHRAHVIQTQTPINPGNSGGPLIGDSGKLLGVNAFKGDGEAMNFAVSVADVVAFLAAPDRPPGRRSASACMPQRLHEGRTLADDGRLSQADTDCDGRADFAILVPDDRTKAIRALIDGNADGRIDVVVEDPDRDGRWDVSYHDVDHDGGIDLVGRHPDGAIQPARMEIHAAASP